MKRHDNGLPYVKCHKPGCNRPVDGSDPNDCRAAGMCGQCVRDTWINYGARPENFKSSESAQKPKSGGGGGIEARQGSLFTSG